jgi:hypothetical protein
MTTRQVQSGAVGEAMQLLRPHTGRIAAEERHETLTKIVCLLAYMLAEPFLYCLGYDILLRPGFPPFDFAINRRTRQVLNKPLG